MYIWKVKVSKESVRWWNNVQIPIRNEYYVTKGMDKNSLSDAVEKSGRRLATVKKIKLLGSVENSAMFIDHDLYSNYTNASAKNLRFYKDELKDAKAAIIEANGTINGLRGELKKLKDQ